MKRLLVLCLLATAAFAQNAALIPVPRLSYPAYPGGTLTFYAAGTSTPQAPFTDQTGGTPLANPVTLDAAGNAPAIYLGPLSYKVVFADMNGVQVWTQDNVRDLALFGQFSISVASFGAKGDGTTDDSAAIGAACTAANGGTIQFVGGLTYKVISGAITTCAVGTTIVGNGATLDLTSLGTYMFGFNIGGSAIAATIPTSISGFKLLGTTANTSANFVRVDRIANFILRDIAANGVQAALLQGEANFSLLDNVLISNVPTYGVQYSSFSGNPQTGGLVRHLTCNNSATAASTCLEADSGLLIVEDLVVNGVGIGVHVNPVASVAASIELRNGLIQFTAGTGYRGIVFDAQYGTVTNTIVGTHFVVGASGTSTVGIDATVPLNLAISGASFISNSGPATSFLRTNSLTFLALTGCTFFGGTAAAPISLFELPIGGQLAGATITANIFNTATSQTISFIKPTPATGSFSGGTVTGNAFIRVTNFLLMNTSIMSANLFSGDASPAMTLLNTTLTGNYFAINPAASITVKATTCSNNSGYACN